MKVKHFLLAFAAILFAACSNESNEQLITENQYQVFGEIFIDGKPADLSRASGGSWEGLGKYRGKDYVTVSYTPPSGYTVTQIREEPDKTSSNSSSHSFGINNKDHTVYADIKEIAKKYTNTVKAGNGGTASGTYIGNTGETHDIKATPKSGWKFSRWTTSGGATVTNSSSANTTAKIGTSDGIITANFELIEYEQKTLYASLIMDDYSSGDDNWYRFGFSISGLIPNHPGLTATIEFSYKSYTVWTPKTETIECTINSGETSMQFYQEFREKKLTFYTRPYIKSIYPSSFLQGNTQYNIEIINNN